MVLLLIELMSYLTHVKQMYSQPFMSHTWNERVDFNGVSS